MNKDKIVTAIMQANDEVIAEFTGKTVEDVSYHASQGTLGDIVEAAYDNKKPAERNEFLAKHFPDFTVEQAKSNTASKRGGKRK